MKRCSILKFAAVVCFVSLLSTPSISNGQIIPTSRSSSVTARETFSSLTGATSVTEQIESTTDFLPFNQQVSAGNSDASQNSLLSNQSLQVSTSADAGMAATEFGSTFASSIFTLTFTIDAPTEFNLTGTMTENDVIESAGFFDGGGSLISLTSNTFTLEFESNFANDVLLDENALLQPDTYTLDLRSFGSGSSFEPSANTSIDATVSFATAVPEPSHASLLAVATLAYCLRRRK
ncbi:PEP-CTERM sorting domain-containing protein [Mariniblastus sp.]|nr:PEP-CTERM sorting domain-containing protein [Mariniblastus sp.]